MTKILIEVDLGEACGSKYKSIIESAQNYDGLRLVINNPGTSFHKLRVVGTYDDIKNEVQKKYIQDVHTADRIYVGAPTEVIGIIQEMADQK